MRYLIGPGTGKGLVYDLGSCLGLLRSAQHVMV